MATQEDSGWTFPMICGFHDSNRDRCVYPELLEKASQMQIDILTTPITNTHFKHRVVGLLQDAFTQQNIKNLDRIQMQDVNIPVVPQLDCLDTSLVPDSIVPQLVAVASDWIDLGSPDPVVAGVSRQVLILEVQHAAFCGIDHIIIPGPRLYYGDAAAADIPKYARYIQEALDSALHTTMYIKLPMVDHPSLRDHPSDVLPTREEYLDRIEVLVPEELDILSRWDAWHSIRSACRYNGRLALALSIPMHIPQMALQARFFSEPVRIAILEKNAFMEDGKGHLGLSKQCRDFVSRIMRLKSTPWVMLWETDSIQQVIPTDTAENDPKSEVDLDGPTPAEAANTAKYDQPVISEVERYGTGYQDYLQVPLQPLADNLESMTYEVFEKDPVKYDLYEAAIAKALADWRRENKPSSGPSGKVVVTVAGAGRGPLVTRAMQASESTGVAIDLWAVEKNPNAFVLLQKHNRNPAKWNGAVHLVQSDMRSWVGPQDPIDKTNFNIDILVTELLGSFADNELSPECLDGILHHLSPQGISIPCSYTPYLTPVSAPKIHSDLSRGSFEPSAQETPAVVWLHGIDYLSCASIGNGSRDFRSPSSSVSLPPIAGEPTVLPVWTFKHGPQDEVPIKTSNKHNERFSRLTFRCKYRGVCHGLAGYFESVLYPGVELSTNPNTIDAKSSDMISWFPIFFPLKTPMLLPDNASLTCSIWRQTDGRKVWYEWMVEIWMMASNHQKIRLGQSEVHSSIKNGCLM